MMYRGYKTNLLIHMYLSQDVLIDEIPENYWEVRSEVKVGN